MQKIKIKDDFVSKENPQKIGKLQVQSQDQGLAKCRFFPGMYRYSAKLTEREDESRVESRRLQSVSTTHCAACAPSCRCPWGAPLTVGAQPSTALSREACLCLPGASSTSCVFSLCPHFLPLSCRIARTFLSVLDQAEHTFLPLLAYDDLSPLITLTGVLMGWSCIPGPF